MFDFNDEKLKSDISCFMEKMRDFGFEQEESVLLLMNAASKTSSDKILKAVDFIEPLGSGVVRSDIDLETAKKEIARILVED